jgi:hypothetical protein
MEQESINERLKFLVASLSESARAFSESIGESPTNTHNYTSGDTRPKPEYLKKVLVQFRNINAHWLMTGEGEPFLSDPITGTTQTGNFNQVGTGNKQVVKGKGNVVGTNLGTITHTTLPDCEKDLAAAQKEIALLTSQLADKERTIQILLKQQGH